ncbi:MAG: EpsG family protein [Lachnospiraceae bacterium]|nr:EpsG family protein [Lachnospiraceae bacterium]
MNLYLLVFLVLAAGSVLEWFRPQYKNNIYRVCWLLMTALLCLRYGQGTDYITYEAIYNSIPLTVDFSRSYIFGVYPEIGWRLLCALFREIHAPFWVFTAALGLVEMLLLHRVLTKYTGHRTAGLFLAYPVLFLVYMLSGLRQGLAMCLFLGIALPFYLEKKWIPYLVSVLIASGFHKTGYIWLILPFVYYLSTKVMLALTALSAVGGLLLQIPFVENKVMEIFPSYHLWQFLHEGEISWFALAERLVSCAVLVLLFFLLRRAGEEIEAETELLLKAYLCGICLYMLLMQNSYYASRYAVVFKVLECVLVLRLVVKEQRAARAAAVFFLGLTLFMGLKNMNAMIREGFYDFSQVNLLNFPYVSVFRQEQINDYTAYGEKYPGILENQIEDQELWILEDGTE